MQCPVCSELREGNDRFCGECGFDYTAPPVEAIEEVTELVEEVAEPVVIPVLATGTTYKQAKICACELPDVPAPDDAGFCGNCGSPCLPDVPTYTQTVIDDTVAMVSDIGRRHHTNEDCGTAFRLPNGDTILIVSDGVSTSIHPTDASNTIAKVLKEFFLSNTNWDNDLDVMFDGIANAHNTVLRMTPRTQRGAEATIVAAWVHDGKITYGWVGDSRIYTLTDAGLTQLTRDDSWIEDTVDAGEMSREDANKDKMAHAVTQVLGMKDGPVEIHVDEIEITGPTKLMLCTDGLWNYYEEAQAMQDLLSATDLTTAVDMCNHYVNCANEAGGTDNVTAAVMLI
jgi:serine/threonine protein phosphatase PrpC